MTPADVSRVTDLLSVGLSNDVKNLYINFETEAAAPATQGVAYRLRANPDGPGGSYCLLFEAFYPGATDDLTAAEGHLRDVCSGETVEIQVLGNMLIVPRKAHKALGKGATLKAPQAHGFIYSGSSYPMGVAYPIADTPRSARTTSWSSSRSAGHPPLRRRTSLLGAGFPRPPSHHLPNSSKVSSSAGPSGWLV